jgi:hypothetical protein
MKQIKTVFITASSFMLMGFAACNRASLSIGKVEGFKPIYSPINESNKIELISPQAYTFPGKVTQYHHFTFQVDGNSGVHVIDVSQPSQPKKIAFITIPGVTEISVKDDVLYADNYSDLVSIQLNGNGTATLLDRIPSLFEIKNEMAPPHAQSYFECVDKSKGVVVKWIATTLDNPKCKTI